MRLGSRKIGRYGLPILSARLLAGASSLAAGEASGSGPYFASSADVGIPAAVSRTFPVDGDKPLCDARSLMIPDNRSGCFLAAPAALRPPLLFSSKKAFAALELPVLFATVNQH
jgi:hypothetical protein